MNSHRTRVLLTMAIGVFSLELCEPAWVRLGEELGAVTRHDPNREHSISSHCSCSPGTVSRETSAARANAILQEVVRRLRDYQDEHDSDEYDREE